MAEIDDELLEESLSQARPTQATMERLLPLLRPYRWTIALNLLFTVLATVSQLVGPALLQRGIDRYLSPGVALDVAQKDVWYGSRQRETGGSMVFADVGADVYLGNLAIGAGFQKPLQYNLGTGGITPRGNLNISATWAFGREKKISMPAVPAFRNVGVPNQ